jgi:glutamate racemase
MRFEFPKTLLCIFFLSFVVTDSGLGGLSIVADAAERLSEHKSFRSVRLVFFNALFSNEGGYNSLRSRSDKIRVFDSALLSLEQRYDPDLVLIGCNTLSVLFPDTDFSRESEVPVEGIVDTGVDERGYDSDETEMLISAYADEALQSLPDPGAPILVSLNCTHYGYSLGLWRKAFLGHGAQPVAFLDPNTRMLDLLFSAETSGRFKDTNVSVEVVSMVKIDQAQQESIGSFLREVSPTTAEALADYRWDPELFDWEPYVKRD